MTKQEEQLWNYIDGLCNTAENAEIAAKIIEDPSFHQLYLELLEINKHLEANLEIDEPSMSFTRNVMAQVAKEVAPVKLKTKVDNRIIYAIGGFFFVTLLGLLAYIFATAEFNFNMPAVNFDINLETLISPAFLMGFSFINAALLLVYLDSYLRKATKRTQKKRE